jgi:probable phosphoglycerate mutase
MTEILLIRHGETLWNREGRMQGQHDSPLTPLGLAQARQLARRLQNLEFAALYASDLGRAHQTARCIADATGHEIVADPGLRERHFGIFEGLTHTEIKVRHPELHELFARRLPDFAMPGGESAAQFMARCVGALEAIAARHADQRIVVVSHGLVLDAAYRKAVGLPLETPRGFALMNCSVNTFECDGNVWRAVAVCDVSHLSDGDVTRFSDANV